MDEFKIMNKYERAIEKSLNVQHWVTILFYYQNEKKETIELKKYDIPRYMIEKYSWVFNWRRAKFICEYPREWIRTSHSYYDKTTGYDTGWRSLYNSYISQKAWVTRVNDVIIKREKQLEETLFPNYEDDPIWCKLKEKLRMKENKLNELKSQLKQLCNE